MLNSCLDLENSILGCIVGGAIGDAYDSFYEGRMGIVPMDDHAPWSITDDTCLTLATCKAIIENGEINPETIANRFVAWFREDRIRGIGASTLKAFRDLSVGAHWALAGCKGERAAGNGAAMRVAPLAFLLNVQDSKDRQILRDVCRITHHNDEAYAGALAMVVAIQRAFHGPWMRGDLVQSAIEAMPDCLLRDRLSELKVIISENSLLDISRKLGCSGWVVESVPLSIAAAELFPSLGFQNMMREIVSCGGDTDTIASMAGQITGARLGRSELPEDWIAQITEREMILEIAENFAETIFNTGRYS
jgi:ADP-ribosylglycohydrolase